MSGTAAPHRPESGLLLLGHGSTVHDASSQPTRDHAEALRRMGLFGEVACGFWKEKPSLREALDGMRSPEIYIVPNFTVEGYFVRQVIPRELGLEGRLTRRGGRLLKLCRPVGTHPRMTDVVLHRAREAAAGVDFGRAALLVLGHGTPRDGGSARSVNEQVGRVQAEGVFAEVHGAFMETPPLMAEWRVFTSARDVVAVPFFIADGLHGDRDIPGLLGVHGAPSENPHVFGDRRLYLSRAVGTHPGVVQVILDQVEDWERSGA